MLVMSLDHLLLTAVDATAEYTQCLHKTTVTVSITSTISIASNAKKLNAYTTHYKVHSALNISDRLSLTHGNDCDCCYICCVLQCKWLSRPFASINDDDNDTVSQ